jgi:hypothetical protein
MAFLGLASIGVSLVDLVIAGDNLIKANGLAPQKFVAAAEAYQGRNARRARRAASLVRAAVDSPMETRIRLLIVFAGTTRTAGQRDRAYRRRQVALAIRPLLSRVQVDHRVRRAAASHSWPCAGRRGLELADLAAFVAFCGETRRVAG